MNCKKKKVFHNNNNKNMDNLHFISNNIITIFFKELQNIKMTINSISIIYMEIILCILLYIFKYIHAYAWGYKLVIIKIKIDKGT